MRAPALSVVLLMLSAAPAVAQSLVATVDPFIGTDDSNSPSPVPGGAGGSTFPGAAAPFGMIQWSPDTPTAFPSGYRYGDRRIEGFSVTHFSGAGCPNTGARPILPVVGPPVPSPATGWSRHVAGFSH